MGDLLRVHGPHLSRFRPRFAGRGEGIAGGLVAGEQHRSGGVQDGGDRERGRLAGAGRHDRDGDVLEPHAHLVLGALQVAQEDAGVLRVDVLGVLQARPQGAGLVGDRPGHQGLDVPGLGHVCDLLFPAAAAALVPGPYDADRRPEGQEQKDGHDAGADQQGRFSRTGPDLLGVEQGGGRLVRRPVGSGEVGGDVARQPGEVGEGDDDREYAEEEAQNEVVSVGGTVRGGGRGQGLRASGRGRRDQRLRPFLTGAGAEGIGVAGGTVLRAARVWTRSSSAPATSTAGTSVVRRVTTFGSWVGRLCALRGPDRRARR